MDEIESRISPQDLYASLGTAGAPLVVDVRRPEDFEADDIQIIDSIRRLPDQVEIWRNDMPKDRRVVVYCVRGQQVSQGVATTLAAAGVDAKYIGGGITAWCAYSLPTRRRVGQTPGKWITRERPTIDRIACPWLINRFIDPDAEFIYVPAPTVLDAAKSTGAMPYDIPNVQFGHHGEFCSFDAFIGTYRISDAALDRLALIIRGADTDRLDLTPQSRGLLAISQGLKINFTNDHAMLAQGMLVYDALYSWCRAQQQSAAGRA
jgi:rhodanese-related sulfurtransferase